MNICYSWCFVVLTLTWLGKPGITWTRLVRSRYGLVGVSDDPYTVQSGFS